MKNFLKFLNPYKWWIVLTIVFIAAQSFSDLYLPDLNATIIDRGVMKGDVGTIITYGAVMLVVALIVGACTVGTTVWPCLPRFSPSPSRIWTSSARLPSSPAPPTTSTSCR